MKNNKKIKDEVISENFISRLIVMMISVFFLSINYNLFLLKNDLVIGGSSGIATILNHYTNYPPATFILCFNIVFIIISFFLLGPKQTGQTIIGSLLYPLFISLTSGLCIYLNQIIVLDNFFLVVILSSLLFGISNGFIYKTGFTTGGVDIIIQIINKYFKIPTGNASFISNAIIIIFGGLTFGINKVIYAMLIIATNSYLVNKVMLGISDSKMFYVSTKKSKEVIKFINSMNTGYTIIKTEGGYSKEPNDIIMCVIPTRDYYLFSNAVKQIDPASFFIISNCYEVYGGQRKQMFPFI